MHNGDGLEDPMVPAQVMLAAEDREYWLAHPEIQGLVAHFTAKVLQHRPRDIQVFARETFSDSNLKEEVHQAIARNGGLFSFDQQWQQHQAAERSSSGRARGNGAKRGTSSQKSSRDRSARGKSSRERTPTRDSPSRERTSTRDTTRGDRTSASDTASR